MRMAGGRFCAQNGFGKALFLLFLALLLIACSDDAEQDGSLDSTPALVTAAETGNLTQVERLLAVSHQADVQDSCRWTPLMKAALNGHIAVVERLLAEGADVNLTDKGGYTALLLAASNNHADIIELLLQHGAGIDAREQTMGWTALLWAAKEGHAKSVAALLRHGANSDIADFQENTPLDWAVRNHHPAVVELLKIR